MRFKCLQNKWRKTPVDMLGAPWTGILPGRLALGSLPQLLCAVCLLHLFIPSSLNPFTPFCLYVLELMIMLDPSGEREALRGPLLSFPASHLLPHHLPPLRLYSKAPGPYLGPLAWTHDISLGDPA